MIRTIAKMDFDGDIVITDPCYVIPDERKNDWCFADCGHAMENLGFVNFICESTIFGDWSCEVFSGDVNEVWTPLSKERQIGEFCADAAQVAVFLLSEILHYNPIFDWYDSKPWTTTLIRDFHGTVKFLEMPDPDRDDSLHIVGVGNKPFFSRQTWWSENFVFCSK